MNPLDGGRNFSSGPVLFLNKEGCRDSKRKNIVSHGLSAVTVLKCLCKSPYKHLIRRWNWKTALFSVFFRGVVILVANLPSGGVCAFEVMLVEICYRGLTSGFFSSAIQSFRCVRPAWAATLVTIAFIPGTADVLEILVQRLHGTERLGATITASLILTCLSVLFELFAMRHGILVMGKTGGTLLQDLRSLCQLGRGSIEEGWRWLGTLRPGMQKAAAIASASSLESR
jgi:hypothetical protein